MTNIVPAVVVSPNGYFDGSLRLPGERISVDLDALGLTSLDQSKQLSAPKGGEANVQVEIAAVAPHAPNPGAPQGFPAGGKMTSTGEVVHPGADGGTIQYVPASGASDTGAKVDTDGPLAFVAADIIDGNVPDILPRLSALTDDQLAEVKLAEEARETPRLGVLKGIEDAQKVR